MREAVIVSYARTGLAKSIRGGFNNTHGAAMAGHAIKHAIARSGIDAAEVEDVVLGSGKTSAVFDELAGLGVSTRADICSWKLVKRKVVACHDAKRL